MKTLIAMGLIVSSMALAGEKIGNGGAAFVCRDKGIVKEAVLADIWEGRTRYKLNIPEKNTPDYLTQIAEIVEVTKTLHPYFGAHLQTKLDTILKTYQSLSGVKLEVVLDRNFVLSPEKCLYNPNKTPVAEQLANYLSDSEIYIRPDIFNALTEMQKAALYIHEAVYAILREAGEVDSTNTRKLVAILFSTSTFDEKKVAVKNLVDRFYASLLDKYGKANEDFLVAAAHTLSTGKALNEPTYQRVLSIVTDQYTASTEFGAITIPFTNVLPIFYYDDTQPTFLTTLREHLEAVLIEGSKPGTELSSKQILGVLNALVDRADFNPNQEAYYQLFTSLGAPHLSYTCRKTFVAYALTSGDTDLIEKVLKNPKTNVNEPYAYCLLGTGIGETDSLEELIVSSHRVEVLDALLARTDISQMFYQNLYTQIVAKTYGSYKNCVKQMGEIEAQKVFKMKKLLEEKLGINP